MNKNKILQSGRSMVEMLGVLAIVGILSIGGIAGYSYAIEKNRANQICHDIMLRAIDIMARSEMSVDDDLSNWPTVTAGEYPIGLENETTGIQVSGLPKNLCQMVFDNMINNATIKIGATEYEETTNNVCGDTNTMVFYVIPSAIEEEICVQEHALVGNNCYPCSYEGVILVDGKAGCLACSNRKIQTGANPRFYQCVLK